MKKTKLTVEEKWVIVRRHYENAYRDPITNAYVKFGKMPNEIIVNFLFNQMKKLWDEEYEHKLWKDQKDK